MVEASNQRTNTKENGIHINRQEKFSQRKRRKSISSIGFFSLFKTPSSFFLDIILKESLKRKKEKKKKLPYSPVPCVYMELGPVLPRVRFFFFFLLPLNIIANDCHDGPGAADCDAGGAGDGAAPSGRRGRSVPPRRT